MACVLLWSIFSLCPAVYHPKCVDEWLQKWNRTCPLCKTAIRRRGAENGPPIGSEAETSHLLQSTPPGEEDSNNSYGATGYTANPLTSSQEEVSSFEGSGRVTTRPRNITSTTTTTSNVVATIELVSSAANSTSSLASFHTPQQSDDDDEGGGGGGGRGEGSQDLFVTVESASANTVRS